MLDPTNSPIHNDDYNYIYFLFDDICLKMLKEINNYRFLKDKSM